MVEGAPKPVLEGANKAEAVADAAGKWSCRLGVMKASDQPVEMTVSGKITKEEGPGRNGKNMEHFVLPSAAGDTVNLNFNITGNVGSLTHKCGRCYLGTLAIEPSDHGLAL